VISSNSSEFFNAIGIEHSTQFSFYWTVNRLWQFTIGTLAYLLVSYSKIRVIPVPKFLNVLVCIFLLAILFSRIRINLFTGSATASFIALAIIVNRSLEVLPKNVLFVFEWLGNRSYSIYLVHMPVVYLATLCPLNQLNYKIPVSIRSVIVICGSVFLGTALFEKIERKFRNEPILILQKNIKPFYIFVAILMTPILLLVGLDRSSALLPIENGKPPTTKIHPWDWDEECKFYSTSLNINHEPCKYSHLGSDKSIMLIGDSHAASLSKMVVNLSRSLGMNTYIFTMEGCGFILKRLDTKSSLDFPFLTPDCIKHNNSILAYVKELKPTVIVWGHHSSSIYVTPNNSDSRLYFNQQQKFSFEALRLEESRIINVGSVPELQPISFRLGALLGVKSRYSEIPSQDNSYWITNWEKAMYLNSLDIFCPKGHCFNKLGANWLFVDENHLSVEGANLLEPDLRRIVVSSTLKDPNRDR
jgi:hypothetical protein